MTQTREYILPELLRIGWNDKSCPEDVRDARARQASTTVWSKMVMMLLDAAARRWRWRSRPSARPRALGVFVSIVVVVTVYHKINEYGRAGRLARADRSDRWRCGGPFVVFAALIFWMYWRVAYVPGGQAIGALETAFAKLSKQVVKLFTRSRPRGHPAAPELAPAE